MGRYAKEKEKRKLGNDKEKRRRKKEGRRGGENERKERQSPHVCKGEIIKKVRKQRRRGVLAAKMAVHPSAEVGAFN